MLGEVDKVTQGQTQGADWGSPALELRVLKHFLAQLQSGAWLAGSALPSTALHTVVSTEYLWDSISFSVKWVLSLGCSEDQMR